MMELLLLAILADIALFIIVRSCMTLMQGQALNKHKEHGQLALLSACLIFMAGSRISGTFLSLMLYVLTVLFAAGGILSLVAYKRVTTFRCVGGFSQAQLYSQMDNWTKARACGVDREYLSRLTLSQYLTLIAVALRVVQNLTVMMPLDDRFSGNNYCLMLEGWSETQQRYTKVVLAYPDLNEQDDLTISRLADEYNGDQLCVVSLKHGIKVPELLDNLSRQVLEEGRINN